MMKKTRTRRRNVEGAKPTEAAAKASDESSAVKTS